MKPHLLLSVLLLATLTLAQSEDDITTANPPSTCQNGGFTTNDATKPCNCPAFWTGDYCQVKQCINGGYSKGTTTDCVCPQGYLGMHCEAVGVIRPPLGIFSTTKTFNLVYFNLFSDYWGGLALDQFNLAVSNHLSSSKVQYDKLNILYTTEAPKTREQTSDPSVYKFTMSSPSLAQFPPTPVNTIVDPKLYWCYPVPFYSKLIGFIQANELRNTAITIVTQHPPLEETDLRNQLVYKALAFGIRINVIWSDDQTFVRCAEDDAQLLALRDLSSSTGGLFVKIQQLAQASNPLIDTVISTHSSYQRIAMTSSNKTSTFVFKAEPKLVRMTVVTRGANPLTSPQPFCPELTTAAAVSSDDTGNDVIITYSYLKLAPAVCTLTLTPVRDSYTAQVFSVDPMASQHIFSYSFVEDPSIDSSMAQPDPGNNVHFAVHKEGSNTTQFSSIALLNGSNLTLVNRPEAALDYVSKETFNCQPSNSVHNIDISLSSSSSAYTESRSILIYCYDKSRFLPTPEPTSTVATTETTYATTETGATSDTTSPPTTNSPTTAEDTTTTSMTPTSTGTPQPPSLPTLVVAYSDGLTQDIYASFVVSSVMTLNPSWLQQFDTFGDVLFDKQTPFNYNTQADPAAFAQAVQVTDRPDGKAAEDEKTSEILGVLKAIIEDPTNSPKQNSLISMIMDRLPLDHEDATVSTDYYPLVNKNIKTLFFIDSASFNHSLTQWHRSVGPLNALAAMTSGHFVVYDNAKQLQDILSLLYLGGPGQNLLFSKTIPQKISPTPVGSMDLSVLKGMTTISITATTDAKSMSDLRMSATVSVYFDGGDASSTQTVRLTKWANTNLYNGTVRLNPAKYIIRVASINAPVLHLRVWNQRGTIDLDTKYMNLANKETTRGGPDDSQGAALNVAVNYEASNASILISDCTGNAIKLMDAVQYIEPASSLDTLRFVPFFCSSALKNCPDNTDTVYQVQYAISGINGGFATSKSFVCQNANTQPIDVCNHPDANGNFMCGGAESPYTRGPTGQLIDCSGNGRLVYNADEKDVVESRQLAPYSCICYNNAGGKSCEQGSCDATQQNTAAGALDTRYRAFTFVVGADQMNLPLAFLMQDVKQIIPTTASDSVWQYQLIIMCDFGPVYPFYLGSDFSSFKSAFNLNPAGMCQNVTVDQSLLRFDLVSVLREATRAVGHSQRGMIVFFNENPGLLTVNLEEFIPLAQLYKQELFVYSAVPNGHKPNNTGGVLSDVLSAAFSTGGSLIYDDKLMTGTPLYKQLFTDLLSSSTSLNIHDINRTVTATQIITVEVEADVGYAIIGSFTNLNDRVNNKICKEASDGVIGMYTQICSMDKGPNSLTLQSETYWITVIVQDGVTPSYVLVDQRSHDDSMTALAVSYTVSGPSLAVALPSESSWQVASNLNSGARISERTDCTYSTTTYTAFDSMPFGANIIQLKMDQSGSSPAPSVVKVFPIASSHKILCANGGNDSTTVGRCNCPDYFGGPDCSIPLCGDGGVLSPWGTTCNCQMAVMGGRTCNG